MAEISVHCVDVTRAVPAIGMRVIVRSVDNNSTLADGAVEANGALAQIPADLGIGAYEVLLHVGDFYRAQGVETSDPPFLEIAPIRFSIAAPDEHYHLPVKFTPWGYSVFRGK